MAFLFFALSKNAWMRPPTYEQGPVLIEVRPYASAVATIYDKEIVLYIASLMVAKWAAIGEDLSPRARFGAINWAQLDRIARDVAAVCTQVGVDFEPQVHTELVRDLFDDNPAAILLTFQCYD